MKTSNKTFHGRSVADSYDLYRCRMCGHLDIYPTHHPVLVEAYNWDTEVACSACGQESREIDSGLKAKELCW